MMLLSNWSINPFFHSSLCFRSFLRVDLGQWPDSLATGGSTDLYYQAKGMA
jgi:hypothetical protein